MIKLVHILIPSACSVGNKRLAWSPLSCCHLTENNQIDVSIMSFQKGIEFYCWILNVCFVNTFQPTSKIDLKEILFTIIRLPYLKRINFNCFEGAPNCKAQSALKMITKTNTDGPLLTRNLGLNKTKHEICVSVTVLDSHLPVHKPKISVVGPKVMKTM